jgi:hypothetical protein
MSIRESAPTPAAGEPVTFELSPMEGDWVAGAAPNCVTIVISCFCCSSPKIGPVCPSGGTSIFQSDDFGA